MSKFQGYAQENREGFDPIEAPNTSDRILRRADETIRGMREVRDADIANTAAYLNSFEDKLQQDRDSFSNYSKLLQLNFQTQKDNLEIQAQKNAERKAELGTQRKGVYEAIAGLSKQALAFSQQYQKDKYESDYNNHLIRLYTQGFADKADAQGYIADKFNMHNLQITDVSRQAGAAAAEANGSSPIQTAELRSRTEGLNTAQLHAQSVFMASKWPVFLQSSFLRDKTTEVMLYGANGTFRKGTPSEAFSSKDRALVAQQLLTKYLKDNGLYGKNPAFLADALQKMSQGTNAIVAKTMMGEVQMQRQEQIEKVDYIFRHGSGTASQRFHAAYAQLQYIEPGQQKAARDRLFEILKQPLQTINGVQVGMSDNDFQAIFESSFSHQPGKTLRELYPKDYREVYEARREKDATIHRAEQIQRENLLDDQYRKLVDTTLQDLAGNNSIDLSDENITLMQQKYKESLGPDSGRFVQFLESQRENTYQAVAERPVVERIKKALETGQVEPEEIMANPQLRNSTKRELIKEAIASDASSPSEEQINEFEKIIKQSLNSRARVNGASTTHESVGTMTRAALRDFRKRYMAEMDNHNDPNIAFNNAHASFIEEFGDDPEEGKYGILDPSDIIRRAEQGLPYDSGIFKNYTQYQPRSVTPETSAADIKRILNADPSSINTPIVSKPTLKKVITQYNQGLKPDLVPQIQLIQASITKNGGTRYSYAEILEKQINATEGLELPEGLSTALKIENAIPPRYRHLNLYPSATNTDIMLMSAGLPSVYNRTFNITEAQSKALDVLAKYESSAYILDNDGGYNAMNQGGTKEGREAINPGHSTKILGKRLTDLTIGEIMQLQESGRLHAAGRYQFTNNTGTLSDTLKLAGDIPLNAKFDVRTQDYLALVLMRNRGISPWIGPVDYATPAERQLIDQAMTQPISFGPSTWQQSDNMNPNVVRALEGRQ